MYVVRSGVRRLGQGVRLRPDRWQIRRVAKARDSGRAEAEIQTDGRGELAGAKGKGAENAEGESAFKDEGGVGAKAARNVGIESDVVTQKRYS